MVAILTCLRKELVARMGHGIGHHDRFELFDDHAGETFTHRHADLPDGAALETGGGAEGEALDAWLQQIDGADVRVGALRDDLDDTLQGFREVLRVLGGRRDVFKNGDAVAGAAPRRGLGGSPRGGDLWRTALRLHQRRDITRAASAPQSAPAR